MDEEEKEEKEHEREEWDTKRDASRETEKDLKNWVAVRREVTSFPKLDDNKEAILAWRRE